jgi:hypothetical protein
MLESELMSKAKMRPIKGSMDDEIPTIGLDTTNMHRDTSFQWLEEAETFRNEGEEQEISTSTVSINEGPVQKVRKKVRKARKWRAPVEDPLRTVEKADAPSPRSILKASCEEEFSESSHQELVSANPPEAAPKPRRSSRAVNFNGPPITEISCSGDSEEPSASEVGEVEHVAIRSVRSEKKNMLFLVWLVCFVIVLAGTFIGLIVGFSQGVRDDDEAPSPQPSAQPSGPPVFESTVVRVDDEGSSAHPSAAPVFERTTAPMVVQVDDKEPSAAPVLENTKVPTVVRVDDDLLVPPPVPERTMAPTLASAPRPTSAPVPTGTPSSATSQKSPAWTQPGLGVVGSYAGGLMGRLLSMSDDGVIIALTEEEPSGNGALIHIYAVTEEGDWMDIGTVDDLGEVHSLALSGDGLSVAIGLNQEAVVFEYKDLRWVKKGSTATPVLSINSVGEGADGVSVALSADGSCLALAAINEGLVASVMCYNAKNNHWQVQGGSIERSGEFESVSMDLSSSGKVLAISHVLVLGEVLKRSSIETFELHEALSGFEQWLEMGQVLSLGQRNSQISLSSNGYVLAIAGQLNSAVYFYDHNSNLWSTAGSALGAAFDVSMDKAGRRVALLRQHQIHVYDWENSAWEDMAEVSLSDDDDLPSIFLSGDGMRMAIGSPYYRFLGRSFVLDTDASVPQSDEPYEEEGNNTIP